MTTEPLTGRIFNIQKFAIHDGPGIRTLVFFQGCPLRCRWCSNPEGLSSQPALLFRTDQCRYCGRCVQACPEHVHTLEMQELNRHHHLSRSRCKGCGACAADCPESALSLKGQILTMAEVMRVVQSDQVFYDTSGGGMTLGGGEPTLQPRFAQALLSAAKTEGIHTAIETCAETDWNTLALLIPHTDLFLVDLKHMDDEQHRLGTGRSNRRILANIAALLATAVPVVLRVPLIPGFNDADDQITDLIHFIRTSNQGNLQKVELLQYHEWGVAKYLQLDIPYNAQVSGTLSDARLKTLTRRIQTECRLSEVNDDNEYATDSKCQR